MSKLVDIYKVDSNVEKTGVGPCGVYAVAPKVATESITLQQSQASHGLSGVALPHHQSLSTTPDIQSSRSANASLVTHVADASAPQTASIVSATTSTLPQTENTEEPLYVNAKQFLRILKRRQARARLEAEGRVPRERRRYLHESRHLHAMKRIRNCDGKYISVTSTQHADVGRANATSTATSVNHSTSKQ